ncbi:MAG: hypothetical protein R3230_01385, partial [Nitrosopumilaceae archaeon]|nr:hypothetical protein [Nitrosopumilaceae archaeon]
LQQPQQQSYEDIFQRTYVQPAMQTYQENILPAIQQRFVDLNAGSSSALNNALAESARNLSTQLGSQFGEFQQRQKFGDIQNQLSALGLFAPFITGQTMTPVVSQKEGWLGPVLSAAAQVAGAKYGAK